MHNHYGLGGFAGLVVDRSKIGQSGFGDDAEAWAKPERVFQSAGDDAVGNPDVDHIGQFIARRRLRGSEADVAGIAADNAGNLGRIHFFDLRGPTIGCRLCVAEHCVDLAQTLDAAGSIDLLDRQGCAEPALLTGVGQRASDRMQHAQFHGCPLRPQHGRHRDAADCRNRDA